jgi:hypothetical protein
MTYRTIMAYNELKAVNGHSMYIFLSVNGHNLISFAI